MPSRAFRRLFASVVFCASTSTIVNAAFAQILLESGPEVPITSAIPEELPVPTIATEVQPIANVTEPVSLETEQVRDRYPDGKIRIERQVVLGKDGSFINHGDYRELSPKGDLVVSGRFEFGQKVGSWVRVWQGNEFKNFSGAPYAQFHGPFSSTTEFVDNRMNGMWTVTDRDNRVVFHIELKNGIRDGVATFYHPAGQIMQQAEFRNGVLEGRYLEKAADGKTIAEHVYTKGQRPAVVTEYYPKKQVKSVTRYLTAVQQLATRDDWDTCSLASFANDTSKQMHGEFITYYENGQMSSRGKYEQGKLSGVYESWHSNGELASKGDYVAGIQQGSWTWRHPNGMRKAMATYEDGKVVGQPLSWNEAGKAVRFSEVEKSVDSGKSSTPVKSADSGRQAAPQKSASKPGSRSILY